jgi:hypothetical protein
MLLVILGEGASYYSVAHLLPRDGDYDARPPLADQLFSNRRKFNEAIERYGECRPIVPLLRNLQQGSTVERVLYGLQRQADVNPGRHRQLIAVRYYLRDILVDCQSLWAEQHYGVTNYAALVDTIHQWRCETKEDVCFVTFNYDTMLEQSLIRSQLFRVPKLISDYTAHDSYKIFKLHGSVDWGRLVVAELRSQGQSDYQFFVNNVTKVDIGQHYVLLNETRPDNFLAFPALAIPLESKTTFECPNPQVETLRECLAKVTKIITIGWRATEQHFLKCLAENLKVLPRVRTLIVSGRQSGAAQQTLASLLEAFPKFQLCPPALADAGFSELVTTTLLENFLNDNLDEEKRIQGKRA